MMVTILCDCGEKLTREDSEKSIICWFCLKEHFAGYVPMLYEPQQSRPVIKSESNPYAEKRIRG